MPNGDLAWAFDSSGTQYLSVADPGDGSLSINKTGQLTVEAWIQLDAMNQPHNSPGLDQGVNAFGKSVDTSTPSVSTDGCEYQFRYYSANTTDSGNAPTNICYYAFNKACGLGAGSDDHIDPSNGYNKNTTDWYYFVGAYDTTAQTIAGTSFPYGCVTLYGGVYGSSKWTGGVLNRADLQVTWAPGQPIIRPSHTTAPLTIGACGLSSRFKDEGSAGYFYGKIGKLAIYPRALTQSEIETHFNAMFGAVPQPRA